MQLWARKVKAKVRYYTGSNVVALAGNYYTYQMSGNSAYDPDFTFIGSLPNSWTTLQTLYSKYMCTYSKVKCEFQPIDAAVQRITGTCCKRSITGLGVPTSLTSAIAQPDVKHKWHWNNGLSNGVKQTIMSHGSTKQILGRNLDPSLDRVLMNADPGEEWVHVFQFWNSATINSNIQISFYATYWVELSDPLIASST